MGPITPPTAESGSTPDGSPSSSPSCSCNNSPAATARQQQPGQQQPAPKVDRALDGRPRPVVTHHFTVTAREDNMDTFRPFINSNYKREGRFQLRGSSDWSMYAALRATSAAPTFFPPYKHTNGVTFVDGGLVANNPTKCAIAEAQGIWPGRPIGCVVSIGTGKTPKRRDSNGSAVGVEGTSDKAALGWVKTLATLPTGTYQVHQEAKDQLKFYNPPGLPQPCYFRFDAHHLDKVPLDGCTEPVIAKMRRLTATYIDHKSDRFNEAALALTMLSGGMAPDPPLLQRIASKSASALEIERALLAAGGVPIRPGRDVPIVGASGKNAFYELRAAGYGPNEAAAMAIEQAIGCGQQAVGVEQDALSLIRQMSDRRPALPHRAESVSV